MTKYRIHRWLNTKEGREAYGIQAQTAIGKHYRNALASIGGKPTALIYEDESRAKRVCEVLNTGEVPHDLADGLVSEVQAENRAKRKESEPTRHQHPA